MFCIKDAASCLSVSISFYYYVSTSECYIHEHKKKKKNSAPSYRTVANWVAEFNNPERAFEDASRMGPPLTITTDENIEVGISQYQYRTGVLVLVLA